MKDGGETQERGLEDVISRALRDNLAPLQRTVDEMQQAYADLVAACGSAKPSNALPALLRAQTAASSIASGLGVLSHFLVTAMRTVERPIALPITPHPSTAVGHPEQAPAALESAGVVAQKAAQPEEVRQAPADWHEISVEKRDDSSYTRGIAPESDAGACGAEAVGQPAPSWEKAEREAIGEPVFDLSSFPADIQDLHRRANRVAKVAMQDIKLLRPKDVQLGRENKDLCDRLRSDLDKARKEYDRRFRAIQDHPVDYFHRWVLEILAEGNEEVLGEYPYPSPVLRH